MSEQEKKNFDDVRKFLVENNVLKFLPFPMCMEYLKYVNDMESEDFQSNNINISILPMRSLVPTNDADNVEKLSLE